MDYYKIGQTIRKYRKAQGLSQEKLAEQIDISITHMSRIETGNAKFSLPVFVTVARELHVSTEDLLSETQSSHLIVNQQLASVLDSCSAEQIRIIADIVKATKISLDMHGKDES